MDNILNSFQRDLVRIQIDVNRDLRDDELNQALFDELVGINREMDILDAYYIHPPYRLSPDDYLSLKLIHWLHKLHPQTESKPFILSNGSFSIIPSEIGPTLYFLPFTSQLSLLYLPLFYHEFGHQLFLSHLAELEDLIAEFQNTLAEMLAPIVSQNNTKYKLYVERASDIVETWREWMEELLCDAVGLTISGEAYLMCFSHYLRLGGTQEFFLPEKSLSKRSHPVSYLRIHFLTDRAAKMGLSLKGEEVEQQWNTIAESLRITEDYFGYYEDGYKHHIDQLLDDMLTEVNPVSFKDIDQLTEGGVLHEMVQKALSKFLASP